MKKNILVIILPFLAAAAFWVSNSFLATILYPDDVLPRMISSIAILLCGFLVAQAYIRLWHEDKRAGSSLQQLKQENDLSKAGVSQLEKRVGALADELASSKKASRRAEENLDILGVIVVITDPDGIVQFVNRRACQVLASGREDIVGLKFFENFVPEGVRDFGREQARKLAAGDPSGERDYTGMLVDRNGTERVVAWHHSVIRDENGRATSILSAGEDVTKRVEDESRTAEIQERQSRARRMEAIAKFAAGIVARLNHNLEGIRKTSEALERAAASSTSPDAPAQVELGVAAVSETARLVDDLECVSGTCATEPADVSLNSVVQKCLNSPEVSELKEANQAVTVKTDLASDLLPVSGSEPHLVKALFALIARAIGSMPAAGGQVVVSTRNLHVGEGLVKYESIPPGDYAVVWVVDAGKEVDEKCLDRIFEPFGCPEQSKAGPVSMAITYGIVKAHRGFVNARSETGTGTEFALCLPVHRQETVPDTKSANLPRGTESIIVVDDSEQERVVAKRFLEKLGYKVTVAQHGREALKLFREGKGNKSPFDLMLLDMIMSEDFDGLDTYRETLKIFPGQKCIIVSGYAQSERTHEAAMLGASQFLAKPFTLEGLAKAVRNELDEKA